MKILVMLPVLSGSLRLLCAAFVWLLLSVPAWAAGIQWEKLPDRERLSMRFGETEGLAGTAGRIALTGVVVPFTRVPPGMVLSRTPEGATLIKSTRLMGHALVIETQTPEFGFLVSRQSSTELDIDFFPNPLGARWRPTGPAPTTERTPEHHVPPPEAHDAATLALAAEPHGIGAATEAAVSPPPTPAPAPPPPAPPAPAPPGQPPVVVNLSGTPEHATATTQMAQAPLVEIAPRPPQAGAGSVPPGVVTSGQITVDVGPLLDAIEEQAEQAIPLPVPPPPLPVSDAIRDGTAVFSGEIAHSDALVSGAPQQAESPPPPSALEAFPPALGVGIGAPVSPGVYGGFINTGGFENIGTDSGVPAQGVHSVQGEIVQAEAPAPGGQTGTVQGGTPEGVHEAQPLAPAAPALPATEPAPPQPERIIVYTDAEGREIPPPPNPALLMPQIYDHVRQGQFSQALEKANLLLTSGLIERDLREELLHIRAEMLFVLHRDNLAEYYLDIANATNHAMNFNQASPRNAGALLRLGYVNLRMNNITEAEARFNMLRRNFPNDENVPLTYYYWGEFHFGRNEMQKAADEFQYILQEFPNSRFARDAALGLARSYYRMGYYERAFDVVDYIERRWSRFYIEYPPFLNMIGDIAFRLGRLDNALRYYWLYMNLQPLGEEADIVLTRLGDIYTMQRERAAAREMYTSSMERFPGTDGALIAMMRLAEDGMYDAPSIAGMFSVFEGPFGRQPVEVYRTIINRHPSSALAPLAEVKLALWYLWDRQYDQSLDILSAFLDRHPQHELAPRAREIMLQTFSLLSADSMREQNFGRMREVWERHAGVRGQAEHLPPESRVALAVSFRHSGRPNEALEILEPLFYGHRIPEYSEMALSLVLGIYLEYEQWQSIFEVARRIDIWELTPGIQIQLDYAMALAAENLGNSALAAPLWQRLYDSGRLPQAQMAYATFFLAREAERNRELEKAFFMGREALTRLLEQVERSPSAADVGKIKTQLASLMDVAETAGRLREALAYAGQYLQYLGANDPERLAVRYRMARIYKKQGDDDNWQRALSEIVAQDPASVFGQLAASELNTANIARDASQFSTTGRI